ncbi:uncharacterized protein B0P05DRAFT_566958 [Gilbertella persicaria]|uniref:Uncharacterized protein n=1 Tax=Rhizopus stolonifer TaxID=4846 RepID=A0A367IIX9_RHIST|nr:uncharacterized protein B0P05DRAFT_566958 [Gilbertella persicaria]KAI8047080.1 hypothetical protein B0P05DRAFT_566958 [Gilbertella persicaria]RCH77576.1 hypothetical protein CU098_004912 [Rhizopus stolonifer]
MLNKCCFCINLRTATLALAILGTLTHLYGAMTLTALSDEFDDADTGAVLGLTAYSYLSGFACLAGAIGVLKNNLKQLRFFTAYYWADLGLHTIFSVASAVLLFSLHTEICQEIVSEAKDDELDMNTCEMLYIRSSWFVTIAMAINMLMKLHFAFAVHSYTKQVKQQQQQFEDDEATVVVPPYPAAEAMDIKKEAIYVAGQEFIPDEKKQ